MSLAIEFAPPTKAELEAGVKSKTLFLETVGGEKLELKATYTNGGERTSLSVTYVDVASFMEKQKNGTVKKVMKLKDSKDRILVCTFTWKKFDPKRYPRTSLSIEAEVTPEKTAENKGPLEVVHEFKTPDDKIVTFRARYTG